MPLFLPASGMSVYTSSLLPLERKEFVDRDLSAIPHFLHGNAGSGSGRFCVMQIQHFLLFYDTF